MADTSSIDTLRSQFQSRLAAAATERALKTLDDEFLSRKAGSVTGLMQTLKSLPPEERRAFGAAVNALKTEIESALQERRAALESSRPPAGSVDVSLPGRERAAGRIHPLMRVRQGDAVKLRWTTDRAIILHLHGYDIEAKVEPGAVTEMAFTARATGRFPIEEHRPNAKGGHSHAEAPLVRIEVYPR